MVTRCCPATGVCSCSTCAACRRRARSSWRRPATEERASQGPRRSPPRRRAAPTGGGAPTSRRGAGPAGESIFTLGQLGGVTATFQASGTGPSTAAALVELVPNVATALALRGRHPDRGLERLRAGRLDALRRPRTGDARHARRGGELERTRGRRTALRGTARDAAGVGPRRLVPGLRRRHRERVRRVRHPPVRRRGLRRAHDDRPGPQRGRPPRGPRRPPACAVRRSGGPALPVHHHAGEHDLEPPQTISTGKHLRLPAPGGQRGRQRLGDVAGARASRRSRCTAPTAAHRPPSRRRGRAGPTSWASPRGASRRASASGSRSPGSARSARATCS